jgi:hypothetical protein
LRITRAYICGCARGPKGIPAVVINGILKFVGVPSREDLKKAIVEELEA